MPENFTSLLEALDADGRTLARLVPVAEIETRARGRRRKRRFTAATSVLAVCAIAAGAALSFGGSKVEPAPIKPMSTQTSSMSPPSPTQSSAHQVPAAANHSEDALLQPSEAPQPALFQWKRTVFKPAGSPVYYTTPICALDPSGPQKKSRAQSSLTASYTSAYDTSSAEETIYHYSSKAAAQADYDLLKPDSHLCPTAQVTATIADGYAWQDLVQGTESLQRMIVLSGTDIAYWFYGYPGGATVYNSSADQVPLQRMADRLEGRTPAPDPVTTAPPGTLPGTAWLDAAQIPFGTADQSHGWVPLGSQQESLSGGPERDLCSVLQEDGHFVGQFGATIMTRSYHGSPSNTPVYPGSNYLYSSADENILTFPDGAGQAQMAFMWAKQATLAHGCQFKDGSGAQVTRKIKVGTVTDSGFSILATDTPGPSYVHLYCVVKGAHVAWMWIGFEQGDTSTEDDAAILTTLANSLP